MTSAEDLTALFEPFWRGGARYPRERWRHYRDEPLFLAYLRGERPGLYDVLADCEVVLVSRRRHIASVAIVAERPRISLNAHFTTWALTDGALEHGAEPCFAALACLLWHECNHLLFRHFRVPWNGLDPALLNVAQDMVVDNFIAVHEPRWRNWSSQIAKINEALDEKGLSDRIYPRLSITLPSSGNESPRQRWICDTTDREIYQYLLAAEQTAPPQPLDQHGWDDASDEQDAEDEDDETNEDTNASAPSDGIGAASGARDEATDDQTSDDGDAEPRAAEDLSPGEHPHDASSELAGQGTDERVPPPDDEDDDPSQGERGEDGEEGDAELDEDSPTSGGEEPEQAAQSDSLDNLFRDALRNAKERAARNKDRPFVDAPAGNADWVLSRLAEGRTFSLFPILRRYVKRLSPAQKRSTWKKAGRKLPGLRPGAIRQRRPGEVVVLVDVSGSMNHYLENEFPQTLAEVYRSLERLARVYGNPSSLSVGSVSAERTVIREIGSYEELIGQQLPRGGATHYGAVLDVLTSWTVPPRDGAALVVERSPLSRNHQARPDLVLFVTDLDHDVNEYLSDPKYRSLDGCLVWLLWRTACTEQVKPCRGELVELQPNDWGTSRR